MKKVLLLAAAGAMFATPALAGGGHAGVSYGTTDVGSSADLETWQGEGAFGAASGALGFQFDGSFGEGEFGPASIEHWRATGHVFWDGGDWRLGGVLGVTTADVAFFLGDVELQETIYGVEGTYNFGERTVAGASLTLGQAEYIATELERPDTWNLDASLSHYFIDTFKVTGVVGFGNMDFGLDGDVDTTSYGLSAEWQPFSAPVSLQAAWSHFETEIELAEADTLSLAVRWNFGGSLRERDNATPFETRTPLYQRIYGIQ